MLRIIQDTREQYPFSFDGLPVEIVAGTLPTGDYSLAGFEDQITVERKAAGDLLSCLTSGRDRFRRELERLRGYEAAAVVVETTFDNLINGYHRNRIAPEAVEQSVVSMMCNYRLPFFFAVSRRQAEKFTFDFFRHYARHAAARYKAIADFDKAESAHNARARAAGTVKTQNKRNYNGA